MRALPLTLLLLACLVGLSTTAVAAPCPLHAAQAQAVEDTFVDPGGASERVTTAAVEHVVSASSAVSEQPVSMPLPDDALEDGCCHAVAATALPTIGMTLEIRRRAARVSVPGSWLPPHVPPAADIFRPPTYV